MFTNWCKDGKELELKELTQVTSLDHLCVEYITMSVLAESLGADPRQVVPSLQPAADEVAWSFSVVWYYRTYVLCDRYAVHAI